MLIDRGILVRENGAFRLEGSIETLEVPESLQALISARLDGLEQAERRLLQDASVLGRTFTLQGLCAITGLPEAEVTSLLGSLVVRRYTRSTDRSRRWPYGCLEDLNGDRGDPRIGRGRPRCRTQGRRSTRTRSSRSWSHPSTPTAPRGCGGSGSARGRRDRDRWKASDQAARWDGRAGRALRPSARSS